MYSYRERPDDYLCVPADKMGDAGVTRGGRVIADYVNPVLGRYYLLQLSR